MADANRALTRAHIEAQRRLRGLVVRGVQAAWHGMPGYEGRYEGVWLHQVVPLVHGAQQRSAALVNAYLARQLHRAPVPIDVDAVTGAAVRGGVHPLEEWRRPMVEVYAGLAGGLAWKDAVGNGLARAGELAATDVQLTAFAASTEIAQNDDRILGYQRVADGAACDFCAELDGAKVDSDDPLPLHNGCGCGVEPITEPFEPTEMPEGVAVHEHGELGPVLADPEHEFAGPAQVG